MPSSPAQRSPPQNLAATVCPSGINRIVDIHQVHDFNQIADRRGEILDDAQTSKTVGEGDRDMHDAPETVTERNIETEIGRKTGPSYKKRHRQRRSRRSQSWTRTDTGTQGRFRKASTAGAPSLQAAAFFSLMPFFVLMAFFCMPWVSLVLIIMAADKKIK